MPKKPKRGLRLFEAEKPTAWDVGLRFGAALRQRRASQAEQTRQAGDETYPGPRGPRLHIRRAY